MCVCVCVFVNKRVWEKGGGVDDKRSLRNLVISQSMACLPTVIELREKETNIFFPNSTLVSNFPFPNFFATKFAFYFLMRFPDEFLLVWMKILQSITFSSDPFQYTHTHSLSYSHTHIDIHTHTHALSLSHSHTHTHTRT